MRRTADVRQLIGRKKEKMREMLTTASPNARIIFTQIGTENRAAIALKATFEDRAQVYS